jgi:hypothetical protein
VSECPVKTALVDSVKEHQVEGVLTCFPGAKHLDVHSSRRFSEEDTAALVDTLRRRGSRLRRFDCSASVDAAAVLAGALPNLKYFELHTRRAEHRRALAEGRLGKVEETYVVGGT